MTEFLLIERPGRILGLHADSSMLPAEAAVREALLAAGRTQIWQDEFDQMVRMANHLARKPEPGPSREQRRRLKQIAEGRVRP